MLERLPLPSRIVEQINMLLTCLRILYKTRKPGLGHPVAGRTVIFPHPRSVINVYAQCFYNDQTIPEMIHMLKCPAFRMHMSHAFLSIPPGSVSSATLVTKRAHKWLSFINSYQNTNPRQNTRTSQGSNSRPRGDRNQPTAERPMVAGMCQSLSQ